MNLRNVAFLWYPALTRGKDLQCHSSNGMVVRRHLDPDCVIIGCRWLNLLGFGSFVIPLPHFSNQDTCNPFSKDPWPCACYTVSNILHACETWFSYIEDSRSIFNSTTTDVSEARICWGYRVSNDKVSGCALIVDIRPNRERQVPWASTAYAYHRLPLRALFIHVGHGWENRYGGQAMNWRKGRKKLLSVGVFRFPAWSPRNENCRCISTLEIEVNGMNDT